ncbi:hypothetical protein [Paenibacillus cremeus]|uniref:Uncharacterized protein n=1 Tax=Paenibacillus cremeus TaxID=2163881 RepID=A0A559K8H9_9BACL|nr:hypothetical protein [Paenibacillus cremeus]TVY08428.1 hypothetical protein FPZ49_18495 [Paenibacillus cremeus]
MSAGELDLRVILTHNDLLWLKAANVFPESFLDYVRKEWYELYEAYADGIELLDFSLENHDRQACLEPGDKLPCDKNWPEFVERVQLGALELYRAYVLEAECCGIMYYSIVGTLEEESEQRLREYVEWNER